MQENVQPESARAGSGCVIDLRDQILPFPPSEAPRTLWAAALVFLTGGAATLLLWKSLQAYLHVEDRRQIESETSQLQGLAELWIADELAALEGLARLRPMLPNAPPERWQAYVAHFLERKPGILTIAIHDGGGVPDGDPDAAPASGSNGHGREPDVNGSNGHGLEPEVLGDLGAAKWFEGYELGEGRDAVLSTRQRALAQGSIALHGPLPLPPGPPVFEVEVPSSGEGATPGVISAILRPADLLDPLLAARTQHYATSFFADGQELYRHEQPAADVPRDLIEERSLRIVDGKSWQLRVVPTQEILDHSRGTFAKVVLGTGFTISILLALIAQLGQVASARARALSMARMQATERREAEAVQLNQILEARVKERTENLQEAVKELEQFNSSISHDLRSPLGSVLNFAAILEEDYKDRLDEVGRNHLQRIAHCSRAAVSMMDSLLAFSRIGREKLSHEDLDLRAMVEDSYAELTSAHPSGAVLTVGPLPVCSGDRALIQLVIHNLLSNALKYSRKSPAPTIEVGGYETDEECVFFVRDNGIGFDMNAGKKLFGLFERLHPREEYEGQGVGLAIARRIVQRHQGRVWAESAPGRGATFFFSIPRDKKSA